MLSYGRMKAELLENADVTVSTFRACARFLGIIACLCTFMELQLSNIAIDNRISLSNIDL